MSDLPCAGMHVAVANCLRFVVLVSMSECDYVLCLQDSITSSKLVTKSYLFCTISCLKRSPNKLL